MKEPQCLKCVHYDTFSNKCKLGRKTKRVKKCNKFSSLQEYRESTRTGMPIDRSEEIDESYLSRRWHFEH